MVAAAQLKHLDDGLFFTSLNSLIGCLKSHKNVPRAGNVDQRPEHRGCYSFPSLGIMLKTDKSVQQQHQPVRT